MPKFAIREAELNDVRPLAACIDLAYSVFKDKIKDLPKVSDGLSSAILNKTVWVAEKEGSIIGGIVLDSTGDCLILENVAVHPDTSGSGVGKALIGKAESECLRLGLCEIRLSTHKDMVENIGLYKYLGWRVVRVEGNKVHMTKAARQTR